MANDKQAYAAAVNATITLASLASDTSLLAGRASTVIDNTANLYTDALVSGFVTTGTTPTAGTIEVWAYAIVDDTVYPDSITGTDAAKTMTSAAIKQSSMVLVASIPTDTTSNRTYPFKAVDVASLFGGFLPAKYGFFVTHSTVAALNSTAANHQISVKQGYYTTV